MGPPQCLEDDYGCIYCTRCNFWMLLTGTLVFDILLSRVLLYPFKSFHSGFNGCFAVFIMLDGIMFLIFGLLFGMLLFATLMRTSIYFWIGSSALQILSVRSSKADWCENVAQSALCSFQVGSEKDGQGISVVIILYSDHYHVDRNQFASKNPNTGPDMLCWGR